MCIENTERVFYGEALPQLEAGIGWLSQWLADWSLRQAAACGRTPLLYTTSRIKGAASMEQKLLRLGQPPTAEAALSAVFDAAGVRAVCLFVDEVYQLAQFLAEEPSITILQEKDYITWPKASGYRSYHVIMVVNDLPHPVTVELQIRTVAMDTWASLEHEIKYKRNVSQPALMEAELRRCADEIASTELSMQTIRDLIDREERLVI